MPTPDDIIESRRIANVTPYGTGCCTIRSATPVVNPNALVDLQASIAAGEEFVRGKNVR
jgi:hypothetical protein